MTNIIHEAAKTGLVIPTERGMRNVVELYKLPLTGDYSLDSISREFLVRIKQNDQASLVVQSGGISPLDQFRLDVLKQVIADLQEKAAAEEKARVKELGKAARRQELLAQKAELQKEATRGMTQEEVDAELAELDKED